MRLDELLQATRVERLNDTRSPYLWTDATLVRFLNLAEREAAERARLLEEDAARVQITTLTSDGLGVATTFAPNHGLPDGDTVQHEGADQAEYNVSATITVLDGDHWTYPIVGTPVTPATGVPLLATGTHAALVNFHGALNRASYALDARLFEIRSARWGRAYDASSGKWRDAHFLEPLSRSRLEDGALRANEPWMWDFGRDWATQVGAPRFYVQAQEKSLTLVPIPQTIAETQLSAYRYPMAPMALPPLTIDTGVTPNVTVYDPTSKLYSIVDAATLATTLGLNASYSLPSPEIHERAHQDLLDWVEHLAFSLKDADLYDQKRADAADLAFTRNFGMKIDRNVQRKQRERRSHQVSMNPQW